MWTQYGGLMLALGGSASHVDNEITSSRVQNRIKNPGCASSRRFVVSSNPSSKFLCFHRAGKNSSLNHVTVHLAQSLDVARALNTFCHNGHSKSMRQVNNSLAPAILFLA